MDSKLARKIAVENYKQKYDRTVDWHESTFRKSFESALSKAIASGDLFFTVSHTISEESYKLDLPKYKGVAMALSHFKNLGYIITNFEFRYDESDGYERKILIYGFEI